MLTCAWFTRMTLTTQRAGPHGQVGARLVGVPAPTFPLPRPATSDDPGVAPAASAYLTEALRIATAAADSQGGSIARASTAICEAITAGRQFWAFGTGHSHALVEEIWGRAGGLTVVRPILEPSLMLHEGLTKSSVLERLPGLAASLLEIHPVADGDVLLVVSNSGRNAVPVEMATRARERGATVIALTSVAHGSSVTSRAPSGERLFEVADVVIDNGGIPGDALMAFEPHPIGPTSTAVGALLLQALMVQVAATLAEAGHEVPTLLSLNA